MGAVSDRKIAVGVEPDQATMRAFGLTTKPYRPILVDGGEEGEVDVPKRVERAMGWPPGCRASMLEKIGIGGHPLDPDVVDQFW